MKPRTPRPHAHGLATLTVVMILFFVLAMVAVYTNRNLIFEQRTSANSSRSAQALAAAEAGVDWAIAMLNGGAIDDTCSAGVAATDDFRRRYYTLQWDGQFARNAWAYTLAPPTVEVASAACIATGGGWTCSCPHAVNSVPTLPVPLAADSAPVVFSVLPQVSPAATPKLSSHVAPPPGTIGLYVRGCNSVRSGSVDAGNVNGPESCHMGVVAVQSTPIAVDSQSVVAVQLGLVSALPVPPVAALTAAGNITQSPGSFIRASNPDTSTGVAVRAGVGITPGQVQAAGPAGSTAGAQVAPDNDLATLAATPAELFRQTFGMRPSDYREQPATLRVNCVAGCTASGSLVAAAAANPTRVIYMNGDLTFDTAATFGTPSLPVMLVVNGNVTVNQAITFNGVIFATGNVVWNATGGTVAGALMAGGDYTGNGEAAFYYDREVIRLIRQGYGSFVRVPGSWRQHYGV